MSVTATDTFYELLRCAIGTEATLSHRPDADEWAAVFQLAEKHSLLGVCFYAANRLVNQEEEDYGGMAEDLFFDWMDSTVRIQQQNEILNRRCVQVSERLAQDGLASCILKGQGLAALYKGADKDGVLSQYRQSGDIDVWVLAERQRTVDWVRRRLPDVKCNALHVELKVFADTDVELHFRPTQLYSPRARQRLSAWLMANQQTQQLQLGGGFVNVPTRQFNLVYLLLHAFRHLLGEGIGLRQLMDYYLVLTQDELPEDMRRSTLRTLEELGLERFAGGVMWVLQRVFGLDEAHMLCAPDVKVGSIVLQEVMMAGNFGHTDSRKRAEESFFERKLRVWSDNLKLLPYFPGEVLWMPFWRLVTKVTN